jgi:hypothetical protein
MRDAKWRYFRGGRRAPELIGRAHLLQLRGSGAAIRRNSVARAAIRRNSVAGAAVARSAVGGREGRRTVGQNADGAPTPMTTTMDFDQFFMFDFLQGILQGRPGSISAHRSIEQVPCHKPARAHFAFDSALACGRGDRRLFGNARPRAGLG